MGSVVLATDTWVVCTTATLAVAVVDTGLFAVALVDSPNTAVVPTECVL